MSTEVFMHVSSSTRGDDERVQARYSAKIGMVVVSVGSGDLYMTPEIAAGLCDRLSEVLNDCIAAVESGSGPKAAA
ncbi:hypothetical protein OHA40_16790 [Nocardia sp. NBC_00508]|uniref:hypothetical protein n=1 Tax=Nocardia sp. NBC_00508 TaxID=2975992 RepID=UPI002E800734|nr:hypothetical protein [Nocardia sp. NBC_00508]WUD69625.1 hypothetical protein OHA40_16790 [Nocardia sp. NBC_00508]